VRVVVKIGGAALENETTLKACSHAVVDLTQGGHQVAVVHGGGGALTRTLERMGKQSEFVNGLRITDAETRDMALMVLSGLVNKKLVAAIGTTGKPAIGLSGGDGGSFRARKKEEPDLGYVGEIVAADPRSKRSGAKAESRSSLAWR
jgi:acetylglutamate kinase